MKLHKIFAGVMLVCIPFFAGAQGKMKERNNKVKVKATPSWAAQHQYRNDHAVYFPDYYTFYEPTRGYIYWNNGSWTTSSSVPSYMSTVDMNRARIQVINEDVQMHPENNYMRYRETYPAQKVEVTVPIPNVR